MSNFGYHACSGCQTIEYLTGSSCPKVINGVQMTHAYAAEKNCNPMILPIYISYLRPKTEFGVKFSL
jgi:hypothetical protein